MTGTPPLIFSALRRAHADRRRESVQRQPDAPHYLMDDMVEDVMDRLSFLRHEPRQALVMGDWTGTLAPCLEARGCTVAMEGLGGAALLTGMPEESPLPGGGYDLVASLGRLDTVNDLPGALLHLRNALGPSGLMIASFLGAGSLPHLRKALLEADQDRPAARFHPVVDVRAGGQLLQRAGFARPVIDTRSIKVRFPSVHRLIADLRAQGMTSVLANRAPPIKGDARAILERAYAAQADPDGRITETFEILTLSGWKP